MAATVLTIAALASFDIVYVATAGGPGYATTVPGVLIFRLVFTEQAVGLASALAVVLVVLVLAIITPLQRWGGSRELRRAGPTAEPARHRRAAGGGPGDPAAVGQHVPHRAAAAGLGPGRACPSRATRSGATSPTRGTRRRWAGCWGRAC